MVFLKLNLVFFIFFNSYIRIYAKEVTTGFCFPANVSLTQVENNLGGLILARDRTKIRHLPNNCLELPLDNGRKELFERVLSGRYNLLRVYQDGQPEVPITSESNLEGRKSCNLLIIKEGVSLQNGQNFGVKKGQGIFQDNSSTQISKETSSLILMHGRAGSISTDTDIIDVVCHVTSSGRFILDFSLSGVSGGISSSLEVSPGQRLSLGQITQDLKDNGHNLDINSGVVIKKSLGAKKYQYWIEVKEPFKK